MAITVVVRSEVGARAEGGGEPALTFDASRVVIGRAEGCEVRLPDASVSPRHASLRRHEGAYVIVDEGSDNGTFVAGARLSPLAPRTIADGELVRVGRVWLELRLNAALAVSSPRATVDLALALVERALADAGETSEPAIFVREGPDQGKRFPLPAVDGSCVLGRGNGVDVYLEENDASRRHVQLLRRGEQLLVRDLGSKNGSFLADQRLPSGRDVAWRAGAELRIGRDVLVYEHPASDALAELERAATEHLGEAETFVPPPPSLGAPAPLPEPGSDDTPGSPASLGSPASAALAHERGASAPLAAPPSGEPAPATTTRRSSSRLGASDLAIVAVAIAVLSLSVAGLWWLLRG
ncbi:MAG: FHA domain-containing protein [Polyangiaceae bacterium]|jgi:pSer/pThr/pTyr-binding forkhead associated (FHA) protein|nr:FHA domain-containing protein [Polyangiaceae bacterium]